VERVRDARARAPSEAIGLVVVAGAVAVKRSEMASQALPLFLKSHVSRDLSFAARQVLRACCLEIASLVTGALPTARLCLLASPDFPCPRLFGPGSSRKAAERYRMPRNLGGRLPGTNLDEKFGRLPLEPNAACRPNF